MKKHAYLIIAHNNFNLLEKQLILLDDERNDLYIHIDLKCKNFEFEKFKQIVQKSKLTFIDRINVSWGDFSQVEVELRLLEAATPYHYAYYHLISGVDLPIKSQNYIHEFFDENEETEYLGIIHNHQHQSRVKYYHFFNTRQKFNEMGIITKLKFIINGVSLRLQKILKVNRMKQYDLKIAKGSNWFSITDKFAQYVMKQKEFILKMCQYSTCADEIFLQTIFINSPFYEKRYENYEWDSNLRLIDWNRGKPYTFTSEDYDMITSSNALFARKFSEEKDMKIIEQLFEFVQKKNRELKKNS